MSDIASFWNVDEMFADWQKGLGELTTGNDLQTAILDSLFTDRLARADDDYEDSDRRGWWGILGRNPNWDPGCGCYGGKTDPGCSKKAEEYSSEALNWLKVDGVVSEVIPVAGIVLPDRLNLIIRYQAPGKDWQEFRFYWIWEQR